MRNFMVLLLLFLLLILIGCFGGRMDRSKAMKELLKLPIFSMKKDDVYVEDVSQMGKSAIITAKIRVALSGEYVNGRFTPKELRIGNGDWVPIKFFQETLRDYRFLKTKENILKLSSGILNYSSKMGHFPMAKDITSLMDILHPEYIDEIVETDGWNHFLKYVLTKKGKGFKIISSGRDGIFFTGDDMVYRDFKFISPSGGKF